MKVFVWQCVSQCSCNYHSGGGVVVFAKDEARARELANEDGHCDIRKKEMPDDVRDVVDGEEAVYIMPDAGCC